VVVINFISTLKKEEEIEEACNIIYQASKLALKDVKRIDNYEHEVYRNMEKDLAYRDILSLAYKQAIKTIRLKPPIDPREGPSVPNPVSVSGSGSIESLKGKNLCQNKVCAQFKKEVTTPKCGHCGETPSPDEEKLVCPTVGCPQERKVLETKFCNFCGKPGIPLGPGSAANKVCVGARCPNKGKAVTTPRCGLCGTIAEYPSTTTAAFRTCPLTGCPNNGKEMSNEYPRCGLCGNVLTDKTAASLEKPKPKARKCINPKCTHYGQIVPAEFILCGYCGSEPSTS